MILEAAAAPAAAAAIAFGDWLNRRVVGWLPDDPPGAGRKRHGRPIPLAGIVLLPIAVLWLALTERWWLVSGSCVAALIGYLDDRGKEHERELGWRTKAIGLTVAAALIAVANVDPQRAPLLFLAVVGFAFVLINAMNFLDNMNGVAAGIAAVSLLASSRGEGPFAAAGYAALGFLPFNWPRARLFLGDAGAYLLGTLAAAAVAHAALRGDGVAWWPLGAVAVPLADFTQVVIARLVLGLPPWVGDRRHLTHILHHAGLPQSWVMPVLALLALGGAIGCALAAA
ncbi:MAG: undecaprenyl/decaprenyl-phosphate alpha-N-acetylglucosaminyl 1-phosphate transferase [Planctomycetes bacterium]|nr:undecaprenyl/decaprenyl-phosphate alpha-N-acetylglucosaminyl 1-phosphate transferase [Planctomycetota bacterium]